MTNCAFCWKRKKRKIWSVLTVRLRLLFPMDDSFEELCIVSSTFAACLDCKSKEPLCSLTTVFQHNFCHTVSSRGLWCMQRMNNIEQVMLSNHMIYSEQVLPSSLCVLSIINVCLWLIWLLGPLWSLNSADRLVIQHDACVWRIRNPRRVQIEQSDFWKTLNQDEGLDRSFRAWLKIIPSSLLVVETKRKGNETEVMNVGSVDIVPEKPSIFGSESIDEL